MASSAELPEPSLASLQTIEELDVSLDAKGTYDPGDGLYPRDGTATVSDIEELVSRRTIADQRLNIVWSSGMAAVRETVNFAAISKAKSGTSNGDSPVIAFAPPRPARFQGLEERQKSTQLTKIDDASALLKYLQEQTSAQRKSA